MREYDRLPGELRVWLARAVLPWRPRSVHRAFRRALSRTRDVAEAMRELDRIERTLVARDARKVWGAHYPDASRDAAPVAGS